MLCAGLSLRPFVACFLLKSEMLEIIIFPIWLDLFLPGSIPPFVLALSSHSVLLKEN